tara:strand:+ start:506 stop:1099 length:594 start_codon:yes stop_codon:yes gene_type:complete
MYKTIFKSLLDKILALIFFLILSPIFLFNSIVLVALYQSSPFFIQERPGLNGRIFKIIKFKTMNDIKLKNEVPLSDGERISKFGWFLRKTSLDEIPQLLNILKGDMSLVGPRPLLPEYLDLYTQEQKKRHNIKPGITGWAQINGRNLLDWDKKIEYDIWYTENISFYLDVKIFFLTIVKVLKSEGINSYNNSNSNNS